MTAFTTQSACMNRAKNEKLGAAAEASMRGILAPLGRLIRLECAV
jgi:hypothetical protein